MKRSGKCPKCESTEVVDAYAVDHGHVNMELELTVATYSKPDALMFKGKTTSTLSAWVCTQCGFVEFYANEPQKLVAKKT